MQRPRFLPDNFILALLSAIVTASVFPIRGTAATLYEHLATAAIALLSGLLTPELAAGVLFVCLLPSTVQSSIAFTSIAGGNVSAAVCSASASNLLGVFLTPALAGLLISQAGHAGGSLSAAANIVGEIVVPFAAGQIARIWIGGWVAAYPKVVKFVDQGSIVLPLIIFHQLQLLVCAAIARRAASRTGAASG